MTICSIIGCRARKNANQKSLTLHRLPKSENKKNKWLEAIGPENIRTNLKETYICSLHFDDNAFNKTMNVIRLQDDAIPSRLLLPHATEDHSYSLSENRPELTPLLEHNYTSNLLVVKASVDAPLTVPGTSDGALKLGLETAIRQRNTASQPISGTSGHPASQEPPQKMEKLKKKCDSLKKKIKRLNETIRRRNKKIADYKNIIIDLQKKNDSSIILKECAGSKDLAKRQILKSQDLPLEEQYLVLAVHSEIE